MTASKAFTKSASFRSYRYTGRGPVYTFFIFFTTTLLIASAIALNLNTRIDAQANDTINFQSKIVQKTTGLNVEAGSPACVLVGADTCDFRVSIYSDSSGGTLLWQETHPNIELGDNGGVFNLELNSICSSWDAPSGGCSGSGITWGADDTLYLEVEMDTDGDGDFATGGPDTLETFDRKVFTSVPFAYYADSAGSVSGFTAADFVQLQPSSAQTATGSTSLIWLNETGGATPNLIQLQVGGTDVFSIANDGQTYLNGALGLGVVSPDAWFDIAAATTGLAQINLTSSSGVDPTAPVSGDLWWNGTNLYFYDGSSNVDLLAAVSPFTDGAGITYLTDTSEDFAIGGTTLASVFSVDVDTNTIRVGDGVNDANDPNLTFYGSDASSSASISLLDGGNFQFTGGILPGTDNTFDLGSSTNRWQDLYLGPASLHIGTDGNDAVISYDTTSNFLGFDANGDATNEVVITDAGYLGIGTDTPSAVLDIVNSDSSVSSIKVTQESGLWVKSLSGAASSITSIRDVIATKDGGYIAVGYTNTSGTSGDYDMYAVKYDSEGAITWQRAIGGTSADQAYGVDQLPSGDYVIAGYTASFVPGTTQAAFLVRISANGTFVWGSARGYTSPGYYMAHDDVAVHADGELMVSSVLRNVAGTEFYTVLCRYTSFGQLRSCSYWAQGTNSYGVSIERASGTDMILAGRNNNFGAGGNDATIVPVNFSGLTATVANFSTGIGGTGEDAFFQAIQDSDGGIVGVGTTTSFGAGGTDIYLAKIDEVGNLVWTRTIGTANTEEGYSIALTSDGGYIIAGKQTVSSVETGYMVKLNKAAAGTAPTLAWVRTIGGTSNDQLRKVIETKDGSYLAVGFTRSYGTGTENGYVVKVDSSGNCGTCGDITTPTSPTLGTGGARAYGNTTITDLGASPYGSAAGGSSISMSLTNSDRCTDTFSFTNFELQGNGVANLNGDLNVSGTFAAGLIQGGQVSLSNFDLAEEYMVDDQTIGAGDVVRFKEDATGRLVVERAGGEENAYDDKAIGVISTAPGLYLQDWESNSEHGRPLGLAGRVPVKVTDENGPIKRGDYLTASSTPGYAMKASAGGVIIGRAMEDFNPEGAVQGDSALVSEFVEQSLDETQQLLGEMVEQGDINTEDIEAISNEVAEIAADQTTIADLSPVQETEDRDRQGRIMMFIDLGYRPAEAVESNVDAQNAVAITSEGGSQQGLENLFDLVGSGADKTVKMHVSEFVVVGAVAIEGDLTVQGILAATTVSADDVIIRDSLKFGKDNAAVGDAVIPAGQTSVQVFNLSVTVDSVIVASPDQFVSYKIIEIEEGTGFKIQIKDPLTVPVNFSYFLAIVE